MPVIASRGGSTGVRGLEEEACVRVLVCVCVWWQRVGHIHSDVFFIHAPKNPKLLAQQAPRPQWSVRVKQSTAFVLHSKSSGIILPLKYSVSQALLLWSPAISQTAEA